MDFIIDAIVEWLKGLLVDGIMGNLEGLFDNVNQSVGEIATQVGTTDVYKRQTGPEAYRSASLPDGAFFSGSVWTFSPCSRMVCKIALLQTCPLQPLLQIRVFLR